MPPYTSEVQIRSALGIDSWRNLSKDKFLGFLDELPNVDREVALKLMDQVPEMATLARAAMDDATKAYAAALESNDLSMQMVFDVHRESLDILRSELAAGPTPEVQLRIFSDIREIRADMLLKDTENKQWLSEQFEKKLALAGAAGVAIIGLLVTVGRASDKPLLALGRALRP